MKKYILITFLFLFQFATSFATEKLPAPNMKDPLLKMLLNRKTSREFSPDKNIGNQTLSNILWAGYGINRVNESKRTIPTARNIQDLEIYVIKKNSTYLYNAQKNELIEITEKNLFPYFTESQEFTKNANLILLYTTKDYKKDISAMHAGSAYQNVAIYCAEHNINNVVKGSMDRDGLAKELKIKAKNILVAQVIGWK